MILLPCRQLISSYDSWIQELMGQRKGGGGQSLAVHASDLSS